MVQFSKTKLKEVNIGDLLRDTRLGYGISLDDIADATLIRKQHLESLESRVCDEALEPIYRLQFLKNYSTYLGLEWEYVRGLYERDQELYCGALHREDMPSPSLQSTHFWVASRILKNIGIGTVVGGVFCYLLFIGFKTLHPPQLLVYNPPDNLASTRSSVLVSGKAQEVSGILINGQAISKDREGNFSQEVSLHDGVNVIEVSALKKYGREQVVRRKVFLQGSENQIQ